jgi:hypothetical protein
MTTAELPINWQEGFSWPYRIAADGNETPYLENGQWKLRVWDSVKKKHLTYNYSTDIFEVES